MSSLEARLIAENDMLKEQLRQIRSVLVPDIAIPEAFRLTRSERLVLAHLTTREVATVEGILLALYSDRPDEVRQENTPRVFIAKIRPKIKPYGLSIQSVWGRGYRLKGWPMKTVQL